MIIHIVSLLIIPCVVALISHKVSHLSMKRVSAVSFVVFSNSIIMMAFEYLYAQKRYLPAEFNFTRNAMIRVLVISLGVSIVMSVLLNYIDKSSKRIPLYRLYSFLLLGVIASALLYLSWYRFVIGEMSAEQIINNITAPLNTTNATFTTDMFGIFFPIFIVIVSMGGCIFSNSFTKPIKIKKRKSIPLIYRLSNRLVPIIIIVGIVVYSVSFFKVNEILAYYNDTSDFFENHYKDPRKLNITFPSKKPNLLTIVVESLETTYLSEGLGGASPYNLLPRISEYASLPSSTNFSGTEKLGGMKTVSGAYASVPGMSSMFSGILYRPPGFDANWHTDTFLPGMHNLGDLLQENGYNQRMLTGTDPRPYGIRAFFEFHGDYEIYDYDKYKELGYIPQDYKEWWGFEDRKLFEFAKDSLYELNSDSKPFNLLISTTDTHFPDGYLDAGCEAPYGTAYENSISCNDSIIGEFLDWLVEQDFYNDTVVMITGDHLTMDNNYPNLVPKDYPRTTFNVFLNTMWKENPNDRLKNRTYVAHDIYPSLLDAMGVTFDGDQIGLGTNLMSPSKTLAEKYGIGILNEELSKRSKFYDDHIYQGIKKD